MGAYSSQITWEPLRSVDSSTLSGAYVAVGGPLTHPSYICKLVNNSTVLVTVSINGTSDIDVAPAGSFWLYDESKGPIQGNLPSLPAGTQIFVKGTVGVGIIYLVSQYIVTL
jgi:hypothetical protein